MLLAIRYFFYAKKNKIDSSIKSVKCSYLDIITTKLEIYLCQYEKEKKHDKYREMQRTFDTLSS